MEAGGPLPAKDKHLQHLLVGSRDDLICCFRADSLACYWASLHAVSFSYFFKALNIHTHTYTQWDSISRSPDWRFFFF